MNIDTCAFECFGDKAYDRQRTIPQSLWMAHRATCIEVPELSICDLTNLKTVEAIKLDVRALMNNDLSAPQEWGLALQHHPANFRGIKFRSRFNDQACLVLFQRDGLEKRLLERPLDSLPVNAAAVDWLEKEQVSLY